MANYHSKYDSFYQSRAWRRLRRLKFVEANGLCERCAKKGIAKQGKEVHHVLSIEKCWDRRLDITNLELLCVECHQGKEHGRESPLQKFNDFWESLYAEKGDG